MNDIISVCCVCQRIRNIVHDWWTDTYLVKEGPGQRITHTYCPVCAEVAIAKATTD